MNLSPKVESVTIVGVGLIGGSIGMALKQSGFADKIIGYDKDPKMLEYGIEKGAIDKGEVSLLDAVESSGLIIIAVPVGKICEVMKVIVPVLKPETVVTDVGSTKVQVIEQINSILPQGISFIGGHPMAGSEESGVLSSDPHLFQNALYILTPTAGTNPKASKLVNNMVEVLGAQPLELDPYTHDLIVACVSHLPHIVASSLVNTAEGLDKEIGNVLPFAAGGFRDTTRIASSDPSLWRDICMSNQNAIVKMLDSFERNIKQMRELISVGDLKGVERFLKKARDIRDTIPARKRGFITSVFEVVVMIYDKPGAISDVTTILGENRINIKDIEILRVREGEGGSLKLAFRNYTEAENAVDILKISGYEAKIRG